jgi:transposase
VGADQGLAAGADRPCWRQRARQSPIVEAVLYRYRAGIPWRDLPDRYGDWKNTHCRFSRWAKSGIWQQLFEYLAADADNEYAMIDSTIVRAHQHSAGAPKKRPGPGHRASAAG